MNLCTHDAHKCTLAKVDWLHANGHMRLLVFFDWLAVGIGASQMTCAIIRLNFDSFDDSKSNYMNVVGI